MSKPCFGGDGAELWCPATATTQRRRRCWNGCDGEGAVMYACDDHAWLLAEAAAMLCLRCGSWDLELFPALPC